MVGTVVEVVDGDVVLRIKNRLNLSMKFSSYQLHACNAYLAVVVSSFPVVEVKGETVLVVNGASEDVGITGKVLSVVFLASETVKLEIAFSRFLRKSINR